MNEMLVPDFKVKINGAPLPDDLFEALKWIEVQQSIDKIDMAVLSFENPAGVIGDRTEFDYGNEVLIESGYVGEVTQVFKGEVISLEPDFPEGDSSPSVIVRAYDKLHKYRREPQTRTFLESKVSDVISELTNELGLSPDVEATETTIPYLIQNNQTNIDYIQELARRAGFELSVTDGGTLKVSKSSLSGQGKDLTWGKDLSSFYVRKSLANVPTQVTTRYWDPAKKEKVVQKVTEINQGIGPRSDAHVEAKDAFGEGEVQISNRPCTSPKEAEALASAALNQAALDAVKGRGATFGRTDLKPGIVLNLNGLGEIWSGPYYVVGAVHLYSRSTGYSTGFEVQRNG